MLHSRQKTMKICTIAKADEIQLKRTKAKLLEFQKNMPLIAADAR